MTPQQGMAEAARLQNAGQYQQAEKQYQQILAQSPDFHPALHSLALMANHAGKLAVAIDLLGKAIQLDPAISLYHRNIGEILRRSGQIEQAVRAGQQAVSLDPADLDARYNLGVAYNDQGDAQKAADCYQHIVKLDPGHSTAWNNLGAALEKLGDKAASLAAYTTAVKADPANVEAQNNLGAIYSVQGRLDEARQCFEAAIDTQPDYVNAHHNLAGLKTYTPNDPHLTTLESLVCNPPAQTPLNLTRYYFALGKARDDIGQYDRAFAAYQEGNRLWHEQSPYDNQRDEQVIADIVQCFDQNFFNSKQRANPHSDQTPVFIVGMPRSGTTLIEQILSSQSNFFGADELPDMNHVITNAPRSTPGQFFTRYLPDLTTADIQSMADSYIERVWQHSPDSLYISDKMPANFFYIGMIYLLFPHARIIHAMRDPMDSCLSCYIRLFLGTMEFAYDLEDLGHYYVRYIRLMQHWHKVLPAGTILDVRYEDMVADSEAQSRRLLEYIGLPWNESCLDFHKTKRQVKTASIAQVRQPIYTTSVARWKQYRSHLQPLLAIVKKYRDNDESE